MEHKRSCRMEQDGLCCGGVNAELASGALCAHWGQVPGGGGRTWRNERLPSPAACGSRQWRAAKAGVSEHADRIAQQRGRCFAAALTRALRPSGSRRGSPGRIADGAEQPVALAGDAAGGLQVAAGVRLGVERREGDSGLEEALGAVDGLEPLVGRGDVAVALSLERRGRERVNSARSFPAGLRLGG